MSAQRPDEIFDVVNERDEVIGQRTRREVHALKLLHRAVHVAAEQRTVDFCAVATFLAEMIGHSHGLQHSADPQAQGHRDGLH